MGIENRKQEMGEGIENRKREMGVGIGKWKQEKGEGNWELGRRKGRVDFVFLVSGWGAGNEKMGEGRNRR